jgi:hypothetical protein
MNHLHQQLAEQGEKSSGGFSVAGGPERALAKGLLVGLLVLCRPLLVLPLAVQLELAVHASADRLAGRAGVDLLALASLVVDVFLLVALLCLAHPAQEVVARWVRRSRGFCIEPARRAIRSGEREHSNMYKSEPSSWRCCSPPWP